MKTWYAVGIGQTGEYGYSEPSSKARVRNLIKRYAVSREKETYGYRFYLSAIPKEALWYANRGVRSPWVMVGR